jgi:hypothetical protein
MSHSTGIEIAVVGLAALIQAVVECGFEYAESRQFQTDDGQKHAVDLVVHDRAGAKVAVKVDEKTGLARFIAHDCQGGKGKALAHRIAQRYAYSRITEELKRKGYVIGKEQKQPDGTIQLVASRWK